MSRLSITDYFTVGNGLFGGGPPPKMGKVSFDLRWFGELKRGSTNKPNLPFRQEYVQTNAHISWSGTTGDDHFHTIAGAQTVKFAQIAHERNGFFYGGEEDDD